MCVYVCVYVYMCVYVCLYVCARVHIWVSVIVVRASTPKELLTRNTRVSTFKPFQVRLHCKTKTAGPRIAMAAAAADVDETSPAGSVDMFAARPIPVTGDVTIRPLTHSPIYIISLLLSLVCKMFTANSNFIAVCWIAI